jgi:hypothetical protein
MCYAMLKKKTGIVLTVHDEIVYELPEKQARIEKFTKFFKTTGCPPWFNRKLIETEISVSNRYGK